MTSQTLQKLLEQHAKMQAKIEAMKDKEAARASSDESRRKFLTGEYILELYRHNGTMDDLIKGMDGFLKKKRDRMLFGLAPKVED